jgi:hypothetical protein
MTSPLDANEDSGIGQHGSPWLDSSRPVDTSSGHARFTRYTTNSPVRARWQESHLFA